MAKFRVETDGGIFEVETEESPGLESANQAPGNFARELTNPNPSFASNVMSGGSPFLRAGMSAIQPVYDEAKSKSVKMLPGDESNWGLKGAEGTGIDILSGLGVDAMTALAGRGIASRAPALRAKAEQLVPRLLPPEKGVIANQAEFGSPENYQKNLAPFIKKSKTYKDLAGSLRSSEEKLVGERQAIYDANPQVADQPTMVQPALDTLGKAQDLGVVPGSKIESMKKLITEQVDFLNNLPKDKRLSTEFVQQRKQAFQKMAEDIYGAATAPDEKIAQQMYRDFGRSNQSALEGLSPKVKPINEKMSAVIQGKKSAAGLHEKVATSIPPTRLERFLSGTPFINNWFAINEAKKAALGVAKSQKSVPSISGKIEGLMNKADLYESMKQPSMLSSIKKAVKK